MYCIRVSQIFLRNTNGATDYESYRLQTGHSLKLHHIAYRMSASGL